MNSPIERLAEILGMDSAHVWAIAHDTEAATGKKNIIEAVWEEMQGRIRKVEALLSLPESSTRRQLQDALMDAAVNQEKVVREYIAKNSPGETEFDKAAALARRIVRVGKGLFLKKECGERILKTRPPEHVLKFLGCAGVDEMLGKHGVAEVFSALRFMETEEWMHETFEAAYGAFTARDFEERDIEIRVLPPVWQPVAEKFVAKKHHNVSHLKEFGVIFLNPIREDGAGKFLRDFALIFHYFHEIDFYSLMFRRYLAEADSTSASAVSSVPNGSPQADFGANFKFLLRGDVPSNSELPAGTWAIIQQYLWKINPRDRRLFIPHVNPESVHWARGQRDLADFGDEHPETGLSLWRGMDFVAKIFDDGNANPLSFDLEDTAMAAASRADGRDEPLFYHQREALWTKLFIEFAGGEEAMQKLLVENFDKGKVQF